MTSFGGQSKQGEIIRHRGRHDWYQNRSTGSSQPGTTASLLMVSPRHIIEGALAEFVMPTISRFYGILVQMYYSDHNPPHVHVVYGDDRAAIEIESLRILAGDLPPWGLWG